MAMSTPANLSPEQIEEFREAFNLFDKDNNGTISVAEIKEIMSQRGDDLTDEEVTKLMSKVDTDKYFTHFFPFLLFPTERTALANSTSTSSAVSCRCTPPPCLTR